MASKLLNATSEFQDSRGQWFTAYDPLITKPGDATYLCCHITVPYAHVLLKATWAANDVDIALAASVQLRQGDDGDGAAGENASNLADLSDSSGIALIQSFTVTQATSTGARMYWLLYIGTDAGDLVHRPQLSILVEPVTRSTL